MTVTTDPDTLAAAADAKAWPFEEARRLIQRLDKLKDGRDKTVIFETGYGPSGLPHIGTFGEVARTSMVRHAFEVLTNGTPQDAPRLLLRRHGRFPQGARPTSRTRRCWRSTSTSR